MFIVVWSKPHKHIEDTGSNQQIRKKLDSAGKWMRHVIKPTFYTKEMS